MTGKVIQGFFLGGQPKLASVQPRIAAPPPIQAKTVAPAPATAFAGRPPGPPIPAFGARPSGPPTPAFGPRTGAVQRHGAGGAFAVDSGSLGLASGGGKPLPDAVRGQMEAALGADFSNVRVHVGPQAERIGAIAFTVGSNIYFAPGRYQPDTVHGQQLLGHELAHVVQQRAGRVRNPLGSGLAVVQDHALEAEADRLGQRAAAHRPRSQMKVKPDAVRSSDAVRVSPPTAAGSDNHRIAADARGGQIGSVMVPARDRRAIAITNLGTCEKQRGHGLAQRMALAVGAVDGTIRRSLGIILVRKEGQLPPGPNDVLPTLDNVPTIAGLGNAETLYLDGHGAAQVVGGIPQSAQRFGGLTSEQLADKLVTKGLPATYRGKIYLNGCNTANDNSGESYLSRFQKALALRGRFAIVKGNRGYSQVQDTGHTTVVPPDEGGAEEHRLLHQHDESIERLQKESRDLVNELAQLGCTRQRATEIGQRIKEIKDTVEIYLELIKLQRPFTFLARKNLRPTIPALGAVSEYEITPGVYAPIPPAIGRSGRTLREHVTDALRSYDNRWKFKQSEASVAAVAVLTNLQDHPKLFTAVRYYLTPTQPKPPAQFIAVGARLTPGSSFHTDLRTQYYQWI